MSNNTDDSSVLIDRFLADFNAIEKFFRKELNVDKHLSFTELVRQYSVKHAGWKREQQLRMIADVRNLITHERTHNQSYPVIPTLYTVNELASFKQELLHPRSVYDAFRRDVITVTVDTPLLSVLERIREHGFTHFPVYRGDTFVGLISENGIARWLADYITDMTIIELADVHLNEVLDLEEAGSENYLFVDRNMRLDDLLYVFPERPLLEAALITHSGSRTEKLLGIATRWDLVSELKTMHK